jgi:hypothetical protein
MTIERMHRLLAAVVLGIVLSPVALAEPPVDKGKGAKAAQGQPDKASQPVASDRRDDSGRPVAGDDANHGQQVSECNHKANERNLKGQDRKDFVEWCTDHGAHYNYDARRFDQSRSCYRKADEKGLSGDIRRVYLADCLLRQAK